jgi:hypothetical protein
MQNNIKLAVYMQKMDDLIKKVDEGFAGNSKQHEEIMQLVKEISEKKADKWVEKFIVWLIITFFTRI